jgi:hypothetical protein
LNNIESKSKRGFKKGDMHVVITIERITIVLSILAFQPKLISMFFHMDSIRKFRSFIQNWRFATIALIIIVVKGIKEIKGENQLLIVDGEGEFNKNVLAFGNDFKTKYEQFLEVYNGSHCVMVLIKNITRTTKGNRYLKAQHYIILTKVIDEVTQVHLL